MHVSGLHHAVRTAAVVASLLLPLAAARAQSAGAPVPGVRLSFQPALTFARFTGDDVEGTTYGARRGNSLTLRASYLLLGSVSGYVEGGTSGRGSTVRVTGDPTAVEVRADWWDLGAGVNIALRCVSTVCPSIDVGGVFSRSREAIIREEATGRPLGSLPIARYEHSVTAGLRLVVPRLRGVAVVLRHQEGLSNLARDRAPFRSRMQVLQLALPLTQN